jgi:hypothetical protein
VDIRSRANTTRGLDYEHMIKARAHKEQIFKGNFKMSLANMKFGRRDRGPGSAREMLAWKNIAQTKPVTHQE